LRIEWLRYLPLQRGVWFRTEGIAYLGFVTDKVAWGRFDSQVLRLPCIIPPTLCFVWPFVCVSAVSVTQAAPVILGRNCEYDIAGYRLRWDA